MWKRNLPLLAAVIALAIGPLAYHDNEAAFTGSDNQAEALIVKSHPDYKTWAVRFWEPPSGEIESLLFALQAAMGAGLLGYYFGRRRGITEASGKASDRASHRS